MLRLAPGAFDVATRDNAHTIRVELARLETYECRFCRVRCEALRDDGRRRRRLLRANVPKLNDIESRLSAAIGRRRRSLLIGVDPIDARFAWRVNDGAQRGGRAKIVAAGRRVCRRASVGIDRF